MAKSPPPALPGRPVRPLRNIEEKTIYSTGRSLHFRVCLYGPDLETGTNLDWSLAPFQSQRDREKDPERADRIALACRQHPVTRWCAPNLTQFNGRIIFPHHLRKTVPLSRHVTLLRGADADGVVLEPNDGFIMSAGGCALVVASDGEKVVAAHGGLRSWLRWGDTPFAYKGLAREIRLVFDRSASPIFAWVYFAIPPESYIHSLTDPRYAENSGKIFERIRALGGGKHIAGETIDLAGLAHHLLKRAGMRIMPTGSSYLPPEAYHTRRPEPGLSDFRNLVVVAIER